MTTQATNLARVTRRFFKLHWSSNRVQPTWRRWDLTDPPPEAEMGGCYAVYRKEKLLYIGVAVTQGKNAAATGRRYGLLNRLRRHVVRKKRGSNGFEPMVRVGKEQWEKIDCIQLIGFPDEQRYLAPALEGYLIERLQPEINAQVRWNTLRPATRG